MQARIQAPDARSPAAGGAAGLRFFCVKDKFSGPGTSYAWEPLCQGTLMPGIVYLKHAGGNTRPGCLESGPWGRSRHETVHHHIMADTSAHDKQMENLMGAEVLVAGIKERKLQGVDDASHRVYDTAGHRKPAFGMEFSILVMARTHTQPMAI